MENPFELLFSKILTEHDIRSYILRSGGGLDHRRFFDAIPTEEIRNRLEENETHMEAHVFLNGEDLMIEVLVDPTRQAWRNLNPSYCNVMIKWDQVLLSKHVWEVDRIINVYFRWVVEVLEIKFEQPQTTYPIDGQMLVQHWNLLGENTLAKTHVIHRNFKLSEINLQDLVERLPTEDIRDAFINYKPIDAIHVFTMYGMAFKVQIERVPLKEHILEQSSILIRIRPIMKIHEGISVGDKLKIYYRFCHGHLDLAVKKSSESFESLPIYNI